MDYANMASQLGIDEEDFMELVELFVTTTRSDLDKVRQGVSTGNAADAAAASHSIKGAAGNLGFEEMASLAKTMEFQAKDGNLDGFDAYISDLETRLAALDVD